MRSLNDGEIIMWIPGQCCAAIELCQICYNKPALEWTPYYAEPYIGKPMIACKECFEGIWAGAE